MYKVRRIGAYSIYARARVAMRLFDDGKIEELPDALLNR
jgi:hypothetical protein